MSIIFFYSQDENPSFVEGAEKISDFSALNFLKKIEKNRKKSKKKSKKIEKFCKKKKFF